MKAALYLFASLLILTLAFEASAQSSRQLQSSRIATMDDAKCTSPDDRYAPAPMLTEASLQLSRRCLDTAIFRPVKVISETPSEIRFANFLHEGRYWTARLKKNPAGIDKIFFQIKRFAAIKGIEAAHTQIRVRLKAGYELEVEAQVGLGIVTRVSSFVISFEPGRPKDVIYNFAYGAVDNYALVGRIASSEQRRAEGGTSGITEQYEIKLTAEQRLELTLSAIVRSEARGSSSFYNTLRPNSTTEIFDLIDSLRAFQGQSPAFLTVASTDPIAGPSIDALKARGLLIQRVQDMNDELAATGIRVDRSMPIVASEKTELSFLPTVQGRPWSLVVILPNPESLGPAEKLAIAQVRSQLLAKIPLLIGGIAASVMTEGLHEVSVGKMLASSFQKVQAEMKTQFLNVNDVLSANPHAIGIYLVPFQEGLGLAKRSDLAELDVPVALPFPVFEAIVDIDDPQTQEVLYHISEGTRMAADQATKLDSLFYLEGLALQLHLQKDQSAMNSQVLAGMSAVRHPMSMSNPQVVFNELIIPEPGSRDLRPVILLSHQQGAFEPTQTQMSIRFGAEGGIVGSHETLWLGQFQISNRSSCELHAQSIPSLLGHFGPTESGNQFFDQYLRGKPVSFGISEIVVNIETQKINDISIRMAFEPLKCLSTDEVDPQFAAEMNKMIDSYRQSGTGQGLTEMLLKSVLK